MANTDDIKGMPRNYKSQFLDVSVEGEDFQEATFIFSNEQLCSLKLKGWPRACNWLEHYPNMENEQKEYDEKYTSKGIF